MKMQVNPKDIIIPDTLMREVEQNENFTALCQSIEKHGIMNPITVRKVDDGYELIAGYRRTAACQALEMDKVPVRIMNVSDVDAELLKITENLDREQVNPIDEGVYFTELMKKLGVNQSQLCDVLGRSSSYISYRVSSVDWSPEIRQAAFDHTITFSAARILSTIANYQDRMFYFNQVVENGAAPAIIQQWATNANEEQKRRDAANAAGEAHKTRTTETVPVMECGACAEMEPIKECTNITMCAYCASGVKELEVIKQFRAMKLHWKSQEPEPDAPPQEDE